MNTEQKHELETAHQKWSSLSYDEREKWSLECGLEAINPTRAFTQLTLNSRLKLSESLKK